MRDLEYHQPHGAEASVSCHCLSAPLPPRNRHSPPRNPLHRHSRGMGVYRKQKGKTQAGMAVTTRGIYRMAARILVERGTTARSTQSKTTR